MEEEMPFAIIMAIFGMIITVFAISGLKTYPNEYAILTVILIIGLTNILMGLSLLCISGKINDLIYESIQKKLKK